MIIENNITGCDEGVELRQSTNNRFYHNTFKNPQQVVISNYGYVNFWDNGYPSGGNYWGDHSGIDLHNGPFQNVTGSDGIGDDPYNIDENNIDRYPLMNPYWNPCDINHDMKVDMRDVGLAARAYNTMQGDESWNCHADITGPISLVPDGRVDMRDIGLIARNFGETYL
jgi:parallel beta-helix repeat protein